MKFRYTIIAEYESKFDLYPPNYTEEDIIKYEQQAVLEDPSLVLNMKNLQIKLEMVNP